MLVLHSCTFDSARLTIGNGDQEVELTRLEARLLALLGGQLDQWVSEREVRMRVWNEPEDIASRYGTDKIEAALTRLRRKFKMHSIPLEIHSSRRNGFRLTASRPLKPRS